MTTVHTPPISTSRPAATTQASPSLEITSSRQFTAWLAEQHLSLVFTTYQAGKVFWIGLKPNGSLSVFERTFERCMGLHSHNNSLYLSTLYQLWRFEDTLLPGQTYEDYDAVYVPQMSYVTGDLDIHDIALAQLEAKEQPADGSFPAHALPRPTPIFVNTLFSCLATVSTTHSFVPLWQPPFIDKLAAEDRCHLNGLAMRDGKPAYVTAVSQSNVVDGWRDHRLEGGCVIDVVSSAVIATGLSMPHSPRWYQERLWLLNSGTGEFGYLDLATGTFEPVAFCPGYLRGLTFHGDFAVVALSLPRHNKTFQGLPLDERLQRSQAEARCGLMVIDLRSGDCVHSLRIEGVVNELYDVQISPGIQRPMAIGFQQDTIRRVISIDEAAGLALR
ncbi:MAG: TIGR03032 family protein [Cyanobacteria bacterium P01_H01_bin.152]